METTASEPGTRVLVYELEIPIRWGDMDAMGHVNNASYFRYMEQVRISWFEASGFLPDPGGCGPLIVSTHCSFLRELRYPGTVLLRHYTGEIGRSSFDTTIDMLRTDEPDTIYASGGARVVWVDFPRRKSAPLPDYVRRAIVTPLRR